MRGFVEKCRQGDGISVVEHEPGVKAQKIWIKSDGKVKPSIVLKSDTFVELGNPEDGSCSMVLYQKHTENIEDGKVTVIGPDICEAAGKHMPFAQIILLGGKLLEPKDYYRIVCCLDISGWICGYMIRSSGERIWCRISRAVAEAGLAFADIGQSIRASVKEQMPEIQKVECIFVTSGQQEVEELSKTGILAAAIWRKMKTGLWKERGVDLSECQPGLHCGACNDKTLCDSIRKIEFEYQKYERRE